MRPLSHTFSMMMLTPRTYACGSQSSKLVRQGPFAAPTMLSTLCLPERPYDPRSLFAPIVGARPPLILGAGVVAQLDKLAETTVSPPD